MKTECDDERRCDNPDCIQCENMESIPTGHRIYRQLLDIVSGPPPFQGNHTHFQRDPED